jgi:hypothetical protein
MKPIKLLLMAAAIAACVACSKSNTEPTTPASQMTATEGVENSAGSYPPTNTATEGTETSGVGTTGVDPDSIADPPAPDTTTTK